jgi:hypothetical protein
MNEMSGRSWKKGYRIHRNHIKESTRGYFTIPNWMIPSFQAPFVQPPFVVLELFIVNKWAAWGGDWGEVWK